MDFSNILFSPTRKAKPTCSNCGSDAHKRSTCPNLPCNMCKADFLRLIVGSLINIITCIVRSLFNEVCWKCGKKKLQYHTQKNFIVVI